MTSALSFKAREDSLTSILRRLCATDSENSPLVQHLLTSQWPEWQLSHFFHILAHKYWWGMSPGSSVLLHHRMWQNRHSAEWGIFTDLCEMVKSVQNSVFAVNITNELSRFGTTDSYEENTSKVTAPLWNCILSPLPKENVLYFKPSFWLCFQAIWTRDLKRQTMETLFCW